MAKRLLVVLALGALLILSIVVQIDEAKAQYRYAAKFICGSFTEKPLHRGDYRTTIAAYNAGLQKAEITYQLLMIDPGEPTKSAAGKRISRSASPTKAQPAEDVDARGVRVFSCEELKTMHGKPAGYGMLMITSDKALNISSVHTTASEAGQPVAGISTGQVMRLSGAVCGKRTLELGRISNWRKDSDNAQPAAVTAPIVRSRYGGVHDGRSGWMSYRSDAALGGADQVYHLKFCVCSGTVAIKGNVRSEGGSTGQVFPGKSEIWTLADGNWRPSDHELKAFEQVVSVPGESRIEVTLKKGTEKTAIAFGGTVELEDGHLGSCRE